MGLQEGAGGEPDKLHGKGRISVQPCELTEESSIIGFGILQYAKPLLLIGYPQSQPLVELFFRDIKPFIELFHGVKPGKIFSKDKEDEEQTVTGIRDNDIRKNGMGMLTAVAEYTHDAEILFLLSTVSKVNDRSAVVIVNVTVPGTPTAGAGLQFWLKMCHIGVKNRFR